MSRNEIHDFWTLAKSSGLIEENEASMVNETELLKHMGPSECSYSIMKQISVLNEKKRKLRIERLNSRHQKRVSFFNTQCDEAFNMVEKMNSDLDFVLRKNDVIIHLRQSMSKMRETLPIPGCVQGLFIKALKDLTDLVKMKKEMSDCFSKIAVLYGDLKVMTSDTEPFKLKSLHILSVYESLLHKIMELEKQSDDLTFDKSSIQLFLE